MDNCILNVTSSDFDRKYDIIEYSSVRWQDLATRSMKQARQYLTLNAAMHYSVLPLYIEETKVKLQRLNKGKLILAFSVGDETELYNALKFIITTEFILEKVECTEITKAIFSAYKSDDEELDDLLVLFNKNAQNLEKQIIKPKLNLSSTLKKKSEHGIVADLLDILLDKAIVQNASDIHLEPKKNGYTIRYRINGVLLEQKKVTIDQISGLQLISRIKILSKLDTTKKFECLEGGFSVDNLAWKFRVRVSIIPTFNGEKAVLRLLDNNFLDNICEANNDNKDKTNIFCALGLSPILSKQLEYHLNATDGVIITTGPTGSGKSTLLYACLEYLNDETRNIITIEDPVERILDGVNQSEIAEKNGLTAEILLAGILRQDPDILLIGEVRTSAIAKTTLTGAITGHLVLTSLHATNCLEVITRLLQFNLEKQFIASALRLLISQRLFPKNCPYCAAKVDVARELRQMLNIGDDIDLMASNGCEHCGKTGISGRVAVYEQLNITNNIRDAICAGHGETNSYIANLKQVALSEGYLPLSFSIRDLLVQGIISPKIACNI